MVRSPFNSFSVLILDQDNFTAKLMNQVLLSFELGSIHLSTRLPTAKELFLGAKVDAILTDWLVDEPNGLEFIEFVRRSPESPNKSVPIVMYTGYTEMQRILEARDAGVNEILAKPIAPRQVMNKLQAALFSERAFVDDDSYTGPDRRRRNVDHGGPERRGKYDMKQDQIDQVMHDK